MTRAQRRTRARKASALRATLSAHTMWSAPEHMTDNPNRGKRHMAPATARPFGLTANESARIRDARRDYRPLTVRTVFAPGYKPRGRGFTTDGYTV